nr:T9SS type A sorting domain-containing protein [Bacteroidota bacterium]
MNDIVVSGTNLFAGTSYDGVFLSTDNGDNWIEVNSGLTTTDVNAMAVSGTNLIAGTWGSGAWSRPLLEIITSITTNELPNVAQLIQNYPNPFNQTTTLKFEMATSAFVNLSVYDLLGCEVAILMNEQLTPGTHEVVWDGTDYPGGIYYYRLSSGNKAETMKMILIK